jgi:hypothetical protein
MMNQPLDSLKHHVTGAIERGEAQAITAVVETLYCDGQLRIVTREKTATGYLGRSAKPAFNYKFKTDQFRDEWIARYVEVATKRFAQRDADKIARKLQRAKAAAEFKAALKPGVILSDSWGWEQTNVEFYKVLSVKGATVELVELGHIDMGATSWASCHVMPNVDSYQGAPIFKRVAGSSIKINSSVSLTLWDGKQRYKSWYA